MGQCIHKAKDGDSLTGSSKMNKKNNKKNNKKQNAIKNNTTTNTTTSSDSVSGGANKDHHHTFQHEDENAPGISSKLKDVKQKENKSSQFSKKQLEQLFNQYKEEGEDNPDWQVIGPEGIERLCKDINVDPEDVIVLALAYELNAQEMGYFSRKEFTDGLEKLGLDKLEKVKEYIPKLREQMNNDVDKFKSIYRFAFQFAKTDSDQKCIDIEMASGLINLLLVDRYTMAKSFLNFLKQQSSYKGMNLDQWLSLLEFLRTIGPNFDGYDETSAWPCIIDEWVEWSKNEENPDQIC